MSILYLKLLPQYEDGAHFSNDILQMAPDEDLFEKIVELEQSEGQTLDKPFVSHIGEGSALETYTYGSTSKSAYGDKLKGVMAVQLQLLFKNYLDEVKHVPWRNRACMDYILRIPNTLTVWLYWH